MNNLIAMFVSAMFGLFVGWWFQFTGLKSDGDIIPLIVILALLFYMCIRADMIMCQKCKRTFLLGHRKRR